MEFGMNHPPPPITFLQIALALFSFLALFSLPPGMTVMCFVLFCFCFIHWTEFSFNWGIITFKFKKSYAFSLVPETSLTASKNDLASQSSRYIYVLGVLFPPGTKIEGTARVQDSETVVAAGLNKITFVFLRKKSKSCYSKKSCLLSPNLQR